MLHKNMNKLTASLLVFFFIGVGYSCREESPMIPTAQEPLDSVTNDSSEINLSLYDFQVNKHNILRAFIIYSPEEQRYTLDLSLEDALSLGISEEIYQESISKLNNLKQNHYEKN